MNDAPAFTGGGGGGGAIPPSASIAEIMQVLEFMGEFGENVAIFEGAVNAVLAIAAMGTMPMQTEMNMGGGVVIDEADLYTADGQRDMGAFPAALHNAVQKSPEALRTDLDALKEEVAKLSAIDGRYDGALNRLAGRISHLEGRVNSLQRPRLLPPALSQNGGPS